MYFLPKIHKEFPNKITGTFDGRPIAATFTSSLHPLDQYLARLTAPLLPRIPGSLMDTTDLLNKLPKGLLSPSAKLITADVKTLYPSIRWKKGIEASEIFYQEQFEFLVKYCDRTGLCPPPPPGLFRAMVELVISSSFVHFKGRRFYHQCKGTAMGICLSVYFANSYMWLKTKHLTVNVDRPFPGVIAFWRYIDDIFAILETDDKKVVKELFQTIEDEDTRYFF